MIFNSNDDYNKAVKNHIIHMMKIDETALEQNKASQQKIKVAFN